MVSNLKRTWIYLKKVDQDKKSLLFVFLFGLVLEIAWIIPGFDLFSLITPLVGEMESSYIVKPLTKLFIMRTYNPDVILVIALLIPFAIFSLFSIIYLFFHCKAYNIVVKKILNFKPDVNIKDLYIEKSDSLKKYFYWELSCFFIKLFIFIPYSFWLYFFADFQRIEHILITIVSLIVFLGFDLYTILTRIFIVPVFISNKYEDLNSKGVFELSKRILSIKLIVPIIILALIFVVSNILVIISFVAMEKIIELYSISWYLSIFMYFAFIFVYACFAYYVGRFAFIYSCSCQQLIFPDNPLIFSSESEDGKIENVYSVFEKEYEDEL